jgi:hypothetical protein
MEGVCNNKSNLREEIWKSFSRKLLERPYFITVKKWLKRNAKPLLLYEMHASKYFRILTLSHAVTTE